MLTIVFLFVAATAHQQVSEAALQPRARCEWEREDPEQLIAWLETGLDADRDHYPIWKSRIEGHARMHGWRGRIDTPDIVPPEEAAKCPGAVLDALGRVVEFPPGARAHLVNEHAAKALERSDRVDGALALLQGAMERACESPRATDRFDAPRCAELASRIAARHGRWQRALELSGEWVPYTRCRNCRPGELARIAAHRARCLVALGRFDEAKLLCRSEVERTRRITEGLVESWIAACRASGEIDDARAAFDALFEGADRDLVESLEPAIRHSELLRLAPDQLVGRLGERCCDSDAHVGAALDLLRATPNVFDERIRALHSLGMTSSDLGWLRILAETGHPDVGPAIDRSSARDRPKDARELQATRPHEAGVLKAARDVWLETSPQWRDLTR